MTDFLISYKPITGIAGGFPGGSVSKESACNPGHLGSIPGLGRSPGGGHGNPLQYSYLENPWRQEPGGLQSMGSKRVRHDWVTISTVPGHLIVRPAFSLNSCSSGPGAGNLFQISSLMVHFWVLFEIHSSFVKGTNSYSYQRISRYYPLHII